MATEKVMLLIDADNVSVDVMQQAVRLLLQQHGALHVRRAYCTAESAVKHQTIFKYLGIKPMVNLATGKNSTDIALAVDAMSLVWTERPDVVVIASSDSDFAPLVQGLRERGCVVRGIGQSGKTGAETQDVYDDFTVLAHRKAGAASRSRAAVSGSGSAPAASSAKAPSTASSVAPVLALSEGPAGNNVFTAEPAEPAEQPAPRQAEEAKAPRRTTRATKAAASKAPAKRQPAAKVASASKSKPVGSKTTEPESKTAQKQASDDKTVVRLSPAAKSAARKAAKPKSVAATEAKRAEPKEEAPALAGQRPLPTAEAVLGCLPELEAGRSMALNVAVQRLREAQLLGKNTSSARLFGHLAQRFELLPAINPSQIRLRG